MATTMYRWYQQTGGEDPWQPIQAHLPLDTIRPTFVTILACDTLMDKDTPSELRNKAKYLGPMYFDLDAEDIEDSIANAKLLVAKLKEYDLTAEDMQVYLSGKKGLHITVSEACFMSKPAPTANLVAIYKEMAFALSVETMDFRVYTAKRGRQFRTCYNIRENGNYKVPISLTELESLTAESYGELCKVPRAAPAHSPQWRGRFALLYDQCAQKVGRVKPKASKPVPQSVLKEQLPLFQKLASGNFKTEQGYNIIAMQLALYAREAGWDEDKLVAECQGVIQNHQSDGIRYNTPWRREAELRRMFQYVEDNTSFDYNPAAIRACIAKVTTEGEGDDDCDGEGEADSSNFVGVYKGVNAYMVSRGEDGDVPITNFVFRNVIALKSMESEQILKLTGEVVVGGRPAGTFSCAPGAFTGGSSLQNTVAPVGGSFSGTDIHARGVYQAMLKELKANCYAITTEGISLVKLGQPGQPKKEYIIWADNDGLRSNGAMEADGFSVKFEGEVEPKGSYHSDILLAPPLETIAEQDGGMRLINCIKSAALSHTPESTGKMLGWAVAAFYAPLIRSRHGKFPLLHVYGPAGSGKTEYSSALQRFYYAYNEGLKTTPNSTAFALQQLLAATASIPLLVDEYKPHEMAAEKLNGIRAVFRDLYNAKEIQRGGGNNRFKDNFNALSTIKLQAPTIFVAEAPETETAIVERSLMVSFKRLSGRQQTEAYRNAMQFYSDTLPLTAIGLEIAGSIVMENDVDATLAEFSKQLEWANNKFLPGPDDIDLVKEGKMTEEHMKLRSIMRPRNVFNSTVAFFGLSVLKKLIIRFTSEELYKEHLAELFRTMAESVFKGMESLAIATLPEYIKVINVMSDMTKLDKGEASMLLENVDYNLTEYNDRLVLVMAVAQCYRKYRAYLRLQGSQPLYPSETAFRIALQEIPQYVKSARGTAMLETHCVVLDVEDLMRMGSGRWAGKAKAMTL